MTTSGKSLLRLHNPTKNQNLNWKPRENLWFSFSFFSFFFLVKMLIYLESKIKDHFRAKAILAKFPQAEVLEIDHYKNIFDKNIAGQKLAPALIIANQDHIPLLPVPENYGREGKSFFFKSSLNCVFDCAYCYLKGNFKTQYSVIFVNYEEIQQAIQKQIETLRKEGYTGKISFYASNYSDVQGLDHISGFHQAFVPFFEQFEEVLMESRTKSPNISTILSCNDGIPPRNTEFSFSLNPEILIKTYEKGTAPLSARIKAIKTLCEKGYKVGLRFLPLLPVENYEKLYRDLLRQLKEELNFDQISSIFIASLIYNPGDFKVMKKSNPDLDLWQLVQLQANGLVKIDEKIWQHFVQIFQEELPEQKIFFDYV